MRFRRRRKPRVQWLPNTGTDLIGVARGTNPADCSAAIEINILTDGTGSVVETPMVLDGNPQEAEAGAALATIQKTGLNQNAEWGYRLRRIVGKQACAVALVDSNQPNAFSGVWVKAGIIVRRIDPETGLSLALSTGTTSSLDPTLLGNVSDPWIWQRSFFLSVDPTGNVQPAPGGQSASMTAILAGFPTSTFDCGGTKDGPAIDIKTARRLGPEERLFHNLSIQGLPLSQSSGGVVANTLQLYYLIDYRVLGTISSAAGNKRNASR